jgi:hypothetical protein
VRRSLRVPTLVGAAILLVAAVLVAAIVEYDRIPSLSSLVPSFPTSTPTPTATARPSATPTPSGPGVRAVATSNLYTQPNREADIVAVLPAGSRGLPDGRTTDDAWVHLTFSNAKGWTSVAGLEFEGIEVRSLPVLAAAAPTAVASGTPIAGADPALGEVTVQGGMLAVVVRNLGGTALTDATFVLQVTKAEGDLVGQATIGPTSLAAGASAIVATPIVITSPGSYRVVLAGVPGVEDAVRSDNTRQVLLIPSAS